MAIIGDLEPYQTYRPEPGSALYLALEAQATAEATTAEMDAVLSGLRARRATAAATLDGVTWDSDLEGPIKAAAELPVLDVVIARAEHELAVRGRLLYKAQKEANGHVQALKDAAAEAERAGRELAIATATAEIDPQSAYDARVQLWTGRKGKAESWLAEVRAAALAVPAAA